jgi:hypothetical protein
LSEIATVTPPLGAGALSETVQLEVPGVEIVAGLHASELSVTGVDTEAAVILPAALVSCRGVASGSAPIASTVRFAAVSALVVVTFNVAITPFAIGVAFIPDTRHLYVPALPPHKSVFPAELPTGPTTADTALICAVG